MRTIDEKVIVALHEIRDALKSREEQGGGDTNSSWLMGFIPEGVPKPDIFVHPDNFSSNPTFSDVSNAALYELLTDYVDTNRFEETYSTILCGYSELISQGVSRIQCYIDNTTHNPTIVEYTGYGDKQSKPITINGHDYYMLSEDAS